MCDAAEIRDVALLYGLARSAECILQYRGEMGVRPWTVTVLLGSLCTAALAKFKEI